MYYLIVLILYISEQYHKRELYKILFNTLYKYIIYYR